MSDFTFSFLRNAVLSLKKDLSVIARSLRSGPSKLNVKYQISEYYLIFATLQKNKSFLKFSARFYLRYSTVGFLTVAVLSPLL